MADHQAGRLNSFTGDIKNNLTKLLKILRQMKSELNPDIPSLLKGDPTAFLPILHQAFVHYSIKLCKWLTDKEYDLYGRNDLRFIETVYRVLRNEFSFKPDLTKEQFLASGFAERKIMMCTKILQLCLAKHKDLTRRGRKSKGISSQASKKKMGCCQRSPHTQYRKVQAVEPEIFTIQGLPGMSSVWEKTREFRVETPFCRGHAPDGPGDTLSRKVVHPSPPRSRVPHPQFMGQITPTRRKPQIDELDVTPVGTPIKPSIRVEREPVTTAASEEPISVSTTNHPTMLEASPIRQSNSHILTASTIHQPTFSTVRKMEDISTDATSELSTLSSQSEEDEEEETKDRQSERSPLQVVIDERIQQLTDCIEKMSARMVLLETQVQLNEQGQVAREDEKENKLVDAVGKSHNPRLLDIERPITANGSLCSTVPTNVTQRGHTSEGQQLSTGHTDIATYSKQDQTATCMNTTPPKTCSDDYLPSSSGNEDISTEFLIKSLKSRTHETHLVLQNAMNVQHSAAIF